MGSEMCIRDRGRGSDVRGRSHISFYSEYVLSSTLLIYSTFIAIVLRDCDAAFLYHCFHLFYDGAVDIQI